MTRTGRRIQIVATLWVVVALAGPEMAGGVVEGEAEAAPVLELRARLGGTSRHLLTVLDVRSGEVFLRPAESDTGELVLRLDDLRDLQFELPASYREAQQRLFQQQPREAMQLLQPLSERLLPFVAVSGCNAAVVVQSYLDLLLAQREWELALALVHRLPAGGGADMPFAERVLQLAYGLRNVQRTAEATALVVGLCPGAAGARLSALERFAHELRRDSAWAEARQLYQQLPMPNDPAGAAERGLLLAYVAAQASSLAEACEQFASVDGAVLTPGAQPLYWLLRGREQLEAARPEEALDSLGRGLVMAEGASEWRLELQAWIARAYRASGRIGIADTLEADLQRLHAAGAAPAMAARLMADGHDPHAVR